MATIQAKKSRGNKYWYIVESRRVNGKPRPVVLAYLGKAGALLKRLQGLTSGLKLKSYSHGAVAALLDIAEKTDVCSIINRHIKSSRHYTSEKPLRNNLTAGITFLLAAIGRVCMPTSKRGWWNWAKTTSCEYMLRCSLSKIDCQHFWDLMDALPIDAIEKIEEELLQRILEIYKLPSDTLFYDTTNFFTYIHTENTRCTIAQRGNNKQKRGDLRQVGLALVVTRQDMIPLFHKTYQGNINDSKIFKEVIGSIKIRLIRLGLDIEKHTIVFDRGNNSKKNLVFIEKLNLYYIGALTPYHHKNLIGEATDNLHEINTEGLTVQVYRDKRTIWNSERTVIVFVSDKLKAGQIRGVYQALARRGKKLKLLQGQLANPRTKKRDRKELEKKITDMLKGQYISGLFEWSLNEVATGKFNLSYSINYQRLSEVEDSLGFRIIMTNHHDWDTADIIKAYHGQSRIEHSFKNLKNPYHLALKPQFHWTDQKIAVHYFICVLGYLLTAILWREARLKANFKGSLDSLLDILNNVRLATLLEGSNTRGRVKATYKLEEMPNDDRVVIEALGIPALHEKRPKLRGVGVYA